MSNFSFFHVFEIKNYYAHCENLDTKCITFCTHSAKYSVSTSYKVASRKRENICEMLNIHITNTEKTSRERVWSEIPKKMYKNPSKRYDHYTCTHMCSHIKHTYTHYTFTHTHYICV